VLVLLLPVVLLPPEGPLVHRRLRLALCPLPPPSEPLAGVVRFRPWAATDQLHPRVDPGLGMLLDTAAAQPGRWAQLEQLADSVARAPMDCRLLTAASLAAAVVVGRMVAACMAVSTWAEAAHMVIAHIPCSPYLAADHKGLVVEAGSTEGAADRMPVRRLGPVA
jgi:hypothetical protein